uniref:(northern house mosquito) hypothetical protein n=1 Tax=Culex pipiens TaxID=7175 RepID=A0A8D8D8H5_CULPI
MVNRQNLATPQLGMPSRKNHRTVPPTHHLHSAKVHPEAVPQRATAIDDPLPRSAGAANVQQLCHIQMGEDRGPKFHRNDCRQIWLRTALITGFLSAQFTQTGGIHAGLQIDVQ